MAQVNNAEVNKALFDIEVEKRKRDKKTLAQHFNMNGIKN